MTSIPLFSIPRHKVFVSYHHTNDEHWKREFIDHFSGFCDGFVSRSVELGDIDPQTSTENIRRRIREENLRESTVTVVLIGTHTWQRKHVDWEIGASLRATQASSRSGLLGILLPTRSDHFRTSPDLSTVPPRLVDNLENEFAEIISWTQSRAIVLGAIHDAYSRRNKILPKNSRRLFAQNRSTPHWTD